MKWNKYTDLYIGGIIQSKMVEGLEVNPLVCISVGEVVVKYSIDCFLALLLCVLSKEGLSTTYLSTRGESSLAASGVGI